MSEAVPTRSIPLPGRPDRAFRARPSSRYIARTIDALGLVFGALGAGILRSSAATALGASEQTAGRAAVVAAAVVADRRCLHDHIAGTEVVSLRALDDESIAHVFE